MKTETCPSYPVSIFMAGDIEKAKQVAQSYCNEVGFCVTVNPTAYIYTGGSEAGFVVGIINYPRFPTSASSLMAKAVDLGDRLRHELGQQSYSIQTPDETIWRSWREEPA